MVDAALLRRAGDLKGELVAFSQQPRYDRAASSFLAEYGNGWKTPTSSGGCCCGIASCWNTGWRTAGRW